MKHRLLLLLFAAVPLLCACGTSARRTLADKSITQTEVTVRDAEMVIYLDDHTRTRKNADRIFESWLESKNLSRHVTGKRLLAVSPKDDGCHLTYDFRLIDGSEQRVAIIVPAYKQQYRKKHRQINSAYVNGRKYDFRH